LRINKRRGESVVEGSDRSRAQPAFSIEPTGLRELAEQAVVERCPKFARLRLAAYAPQVRVGLSRE
jgi:hypothetical protein